MHPSKLHCHLLAIAIALEQQKLEAEAVKEYPAGWLKNAKTIARDTSGRFASKVNQTAESARETASSFADKVDGLIKEKKHQVDSKVLELAGKQIERLKEKHPETLEKALDAMFGKTSEEIRDELAEAYAEINPDMQNAVQPNPFKELANDLSRIRDGATPEEIGKDLLKSFEYVGYQYNKTIDDLNHVEGNAAMRLAGKAAAIAIPTAVFLGSTFGPEIAIALVLDEAIPNVLASFTGGKIAEMVADKAMEESIENTWVKEGIKLAALVAGANIGKAAMERAHPFLVKQATEGIMKIREARVPKISSIEDIVEIAETENVGSFQKISEYLDDAVEGGLDNLLNLVEGSHIGMRTLLEKQMRKVSASMKQIPKGVSASLKTAQRKLKAELDSRKAIDELIASGNQKKIIREKVRLQQKFIKDLEDIRQKYPDAENIFDQQDARSKIAELNLNAKNLKTKDKNLYSDLEKLLEKHSTYQKLSDHLLDYQKPAGFVERNAAKARLYAVAKIENLPKQLKEKAKKSLKSLPLGLWRKFMWNIKRIPDALIGSVLTAIAVQWRQEKTNKNNEEAVKKVENKMDEILKKITNQGSKENG